MKAIVIITKFMLYLVLTSAFCFGLIWLGGWELSRGEDAHAAAVGSAILACLVYGIADVFSGEEDD